MKNPARVMMKIVSVKGTCAAKHQVGQEFDLSEDFTVGMSGHPKTICTSLFYAIYPNYRVLRFGGSLPWEQNPDVAHVACSDGDNPVIVQLRRIPEKG